jgi:serine/threonine protein kinase
MPLATGSRLGPYEITAAIGAGGMGEVYRARDTRLDRIVAIKILPDHLADRSELHERFEREARTIASLNHPHICTIYDIGRWRATRRTKTRPAMSACGYSSGSISRTPKNSCISEITRLQEGKANVKTHSRQEPSRRGYVYDCTD